MGPLLLWVPKPDKDTMKKKTKIDCGMSVYNPSPGRLR